TAPQRSTPATSSAMRDRPLPGEPDTPEIDATVSLADLLRASMPEAADTLLMRVEGLLHSPRIRALPERSRRQLDALLPAAVQAAAGTRSPTAALNRLLDLFEQIAQRRVYLSLLAEYPQALARVARMVAASEWVALYL